MFLVEHDDVIEKLFAKRFHRTLGRAILPRRPIADELPLHSHVLDRGRHASLEDRIVIEHGCVSSHPGRFLTQLRGPRNRCPFEDPESTPQALQRKVLAPGSLRALRAPFASRGSWSLPDSIHFVDSVHSGSGTSRTIFVGSPAPATPQLHAGLRPVAQQLHHLARSTSRPASDHGTPHAGQPYCVRGHRNRCAGEAWRSRSSCSGKATRA